MRSFLVSTSLFQQFSRLGKFWIDELDQRIFWVLLDGIDFRGDAHPLVTGFSKPNFRGLETLADAEDYMDGKGVMLYNYDIKYGAGKSNLIDGKTAYYAVVNGRRPGIQSYYQ